MKRVALTARGATVSFLMDELLSYGDALGALIDHKEGLGEFTDDHMESLASLHSKMRTAILLSTSAERLTRDARAHLTEVDIEDLRTADGLADGPLDGGVE